MQYGNFKNRKKMMNNFKEKWLIWGLNDGCYMTFICIDLPSLLVHKANYYKKDKLRALI